MTDLISKRIYVAGHAGMVGQAVVRRLNQAGVRNLILRTRQELDLRNQSATQAFFEQQRPDLVIFAAGKVGGIHANNTYPAEFIYDNLIMAANAIDAAYRTGVQRFLYLGSSCIYPRMAPQPISEDCLLTGPLEKTNEAYALAKIAGLKMCQYYRSQYGVLFHSAMPTNLYGPGDNYHPDNSHVVPALIRRFHEAVEQQLESVTIWGTGKARREFMHVDDLAGGVWHLCQLPDPPDLVNLGTGTDVTILELAQLVSDLVGFEGTILTDPAKPDGTPVKLTDVRRVSATGWQAAIDLKSGLTSTYQAFLSERKQKQLRYA